MVEFCPECSGLLRKKYMSGEIFLVCRCGYKKNSKKDDYEIEKSITKKREDLKKNLLIIGQEDKILVHPIVKKECPKCGYVDAEAWQVQIRSADEPSTSFFKCVKCKHTCREN